jgi:hypothetical protein
MSGPPPVPPRKGPPPVGKKKEESKGPPPAPKKKPEEPPSPKAFDDDEEVGGTYGTVAEPVEELDAKGRKKKKKEDEINYGSLRDKYHKSKKGPAMAAVVKPSNALIFWGILVGLIGLATIMVGVWPFIFGEKKLAKKEQTDQFIFIASGLMSMLQASVICWGASKMQSLESKPLAWIAAIISLPLGIWAMIVLSKDFVKEGFDEVAEGEVV